MYDNSVIIRPRFKKKKKKVYVHIQVHMYACICKDCSARNNVLENTRIFFLDHETATQYLFCTFYYF